METIILVGSCLATWETSKRHSDGASGHIQVKSWLCSCTTTGCCETSFTRGFFMRLNGQTMRDFNSSNSYNISLLLSQLNTSCNLTISFPKEYYIITFMGFLSKIMCGKPYEKSMKLLLFWITVYWTYYSLKLSLMTLCLVIKQHHQSIHETS